MREEQEIFDRWKAEIDFAQKDKRYQKWLKKCDKIVARYRDERDNELEESVRRFNSLWSNVETLKPALYSRMPKPIVERRFVDRDPVARTASTLLERVLSFQMEVGYFHEATEEAVLDHLLGGMGQVWLRYEPQIESQAIATENAEVEKSERTAEQIAEDGDGTPYETVTYERVCADYLYYKDFLWGPARRWAQVPWVGKRSYLTRSECKERFKEKGARVTLDYTPDRLNGTEEDEKTVSYFKKAEIWEIWNKADRKVYFIAPGTPGLVLEVRDDPLNLEHFWPCPKPLFATQTTDTVVPVPDYLEYQDQAMELDDLTNRIAAITSAIKAAGVYDSSYPALQRLLQDGHDNSLIPVDQWAAFSEKGGIPGAISLLPMQEVMEVLVRLYEARAQVKNDLFEITGISDIVRGQGTGSAKTATEQRIKGQFASLRLQKRQSDVARFCRDALRIKAEIIAEMFSPESIMLMSGHQQAIQDEMRKAAEAVPPPKMGHNGGPPMEGAPPPDPAMQQQMQMQAQQQHQAAQQQAAEGAQQKAMQEFEQALQILRSDRLRGFRIDIETDSTIEPDAQADKQAAIELVSSTLQGLTAAGEVVMTAPELMKPIGDLLLFVYRRFRVGRTIEAEMEQAIDQLKERLENPGPKPPSPEEIKAQGEQQKQQMEMEKSKFQMQADQQSKAMDLQMKQEEHRMKLEQMQAEMALKTEELRLKEQELALKEREMMMKVQMADHQAAVDMRKTEIQADAAERQAELGAEADTRKHALGLEALEAKTAAQKQAAKAKPKEERRS